MKTSPCNSRVSPAAPSGLTSVRLALISTATPPAVGALWAGCLGPSGLGLGPDRDGGGAARGRGLDEADTSVSWNGLPHPTQAAAPEGLDVPQEGHRG